MEFAFIILFCEGDNEPSHITEEEVGARRSGGVIEEGDNGGTKKSTLLYEFQSMSIEDGEKRLGIQNENNELLVEEIKKK